MRELDYSNLEVKLSVIKPVLVRWKIGTWFKFYKDHYFYKVTYLSFLYNTKDIGKFRAWLCGHRCRGCGSKQNLSNCERKTCRVCFCRSCWSIQPTCLICYSKKSLDPTKLLFMTMDKADISEGSDIESHDFTPLLDWIGCS